MEVVNLVIIAIQLPRAGHLLILNIQYFMLRVKPLINFTSLVGQNLRDVLSVILVFYHVPN